jgi:hypothetical protein
MLLTFGALAGRDQRSAGPRPAGRVGDWAVMNSVTPNDESTTAAGDGWSEDMELAPVHPGDRPAAEPDGEALGASART